MPRIVPSQVVEVIDTLFPNAKTEVERHTLELTWSDAPKLLTILELANKLPDQLLVMPPERYAEYVASLGTIQWFLGRWQTTERISPAYSRTFTTIPGLRQLSAVGLIRQALAQCPDEFPAASTAELNFITDPSFKANLRLDISAVDAALTNNEWKAATVLAGSVVEALLLWALQQRQPADITHATEVLGRRFESDIQRWVLADYIDVAGQLGIVKPDTTAQCRLAKDFRNLIHPGRAQRLGQPCNRGTALSAVAAIEHVVSDLTP
jgi:hypothetical protein